MEILLLEDDKVLAVNFYVTTHNQKYSLRSCLW